MGGMIYLFIYYYYYLFVLGLQLGRVELGW